MTTATYNEKEYLEQVEECLNAWYGPEAKAANFYRKYQETVDEVLASWFGESTQS